MDENYLQHELYQLILSDTKYFDFLHEGSLDGIWYWDLTDMEQEWMSPKFWITFGYKPSEKKHLASEWQKMIYPEDLELTRKNLQQHLENPHHAYDQVVRFKHKNGLPIWVRCRGMAIRDEKSGEPLRMLGAHTNITKQMQATAMVTAMQFQIEAQQMRSETLSMQVELKDTQIKELKEQLRLRGKEIESLQRELNAVRNS